MLSYRTAKVLCILVSIAGLLSGCSTDVAGPYRAPTAMAGIDQVIEAGKPATLDGSLSFDPDGDSLTFQWDLISAPAGATATIDNDRAAVTSLTANVSGIWLVRLVVSDSRLASEPDIVRIKLFDTTSKDDQDCTD